MTVSDKCQKCVDILCCFVWENERSEFPLGEGSSSWVLLLVEVKYRAEISLKIVKIA